MTDTPAVPQIRSHGSGRTGSLANQYEVTPQAIRRDLNIMCNKKLPLRVPGGAVVSGDIAPCGREPANPDCTTRRLINTEGKDRNGRMTA
ncbi:MAG: DeoR family transcriptional regulator [Gammaproteobacteria bacterium]|nr:DeoR family transcriptional regulator [Gammaproteobacteria bacterium]MYG65186.1 DeoR family transcriptional regulator [Gammaproteobacteria bacterium]